MKSHHLLLFAITGLLMGCTQGDEPFGEPKASVPITLSGSKSANSFAATPTGFKDGAQLGTYITTAGTALKQSNNHADNTPFTATTSGFTATNTLFPTDGSAIDIYAYTPYNSGLTLDAAQTIPFAIKTVQTDAESSDLLWSKSTNIAQGGVPALVFDHKLSQIVVTLSAASGVVFSSPTVTIDGTLPSVKLNLIDGTLSGATGNALSITPTKISDSEMHAIIVPQSVGMNTNFITVQNGAKTFKHALTKNYNFEPGKSYTFEITVKDNSIDVNFTGSVNGWTSSDTTTGDAI